MEIDESEIGKLLVGIIQKEHGIKVSGGGVLHNKIDEMNKKLSELIDINIGTRNVLLEILSLRKR